MTRRQSMPEQWLIVSERPDAELWRSVRRLQRGSGILILAELRPAERRRLRNFARHRELTVIAEGEAARVHDVVELRAALAKRRPMILLSPLYPTASHPDWPPLPRMRAATLARLGGRELFALGGMDARKFARVRNLGFLGWAGITAFRT